MVVGNFNLTLPLGEAATRVVIAGPDCTAPAVHEQESVLPERKTPMQWHALPPAGIRGSHQAFNEAWSARVFRGRLHELMTAEEWRALIAPYLPDQTPAAPYRIRLGKPVAEDR